MRTLTRVSARAYDRAMGTSRLTAQVTPSPATVRDRMHPRDVHIARLLALQRSAGNRAVSRMLSTRRLARAFDPYIAPKPVTLIDDDGKEIAVEAKTRCEVDLDRFKQSEKGLQFRVRLDGRREGWIDEAAYRTMKGVQRTPGELKKPSEPETQQKPAEPEKPEKPQVAMGSGNVPALDAAPALPLVTAGAHGLIVNVTPALRRRYMQDLKRLEVWLEEREGQILAENLDVHVRVLQSGDSDLLTETLSYGAENATNQGVIVLAGGHYIVVAASNDAPDYKDTTGQGWVQLVETRTDGSCLADALHIVRTNANATDEEILGYRAALAALQDDELDPLLESLVVDLLEGRRVRGLGPAVRGYLELQPDFLAFGKELKEKREEKREEERKRDEERKQREAKMTSETGGLETGSEERKLSEADQASEKGDVESESDEESEQEKLEGSATAAPKQEASKKNGTLGWGDVVVIQTNYHRSEMRVGTGQGAAWLTKGEVTKAVLEQMRGSFGNRHFRVPHHTTTSNYWKLNTIFGRQRGGLRVDLENYHEALARWQRVKLQPGSGQQGGWLLYVPEDGSAIEYDAEIMIRSFAQVVATGAYHLVYPSNVKPAPADPAAGEQAAKSTPKAKKESKKDKHRKKLEKQSKR
jgi:hypothetical protein